AFCVIRHLPPIPTLFPYTTLFRSKDLLGPWQFSRYSHMTPTLYESMLEKGISKEHLFYSKGSGVNEAIDGGIDAAVVKRSKQIRSEEHTSELQSRFDLVCRLLLEK